MGLLESMRMRMNEFDMIELIPLVAKLSEKYTSKESTSVSYEVAKQLMGAVIYCINENNQVHHQESPTDLIDSNLDISAEKAYSKGYELVIQKVKKTKALYELIINDFDAYRNRSYEDTIVKGMPAFFLYYDVRFQPQNHILTLDYPTIGDLEELCGVDAIYQYLHYVRLEQIFLQAYPNDYVVQLLVCFHNDYEELFFNICRVVLRNVICNMIAKKQLRNVGVKLNDYDSIKDFVRGVDDQKLELKLLSFIQVLIKQKYGDNQMLFAYLKNDVEEFAFELKNAVECECLQTIFVL